MATEKIKDRVFIAHGWASGPDDCWIPWLKNELEERGYEVYALSFPNPKEPNIEKWVYTLSNRVGAPDERTFFIGHSMGCFIIFKYIERLPRDIRVGGVLCVGGRLERSGWPGLHFNILRRRVNKVRGLYSDDDYHVPLSEEKLLRHEFKAQTRILKNRGHFSRLEETRKLPEALDEILLLMEEASLDKRDDSV